MNKARRDLGVGAALGYQRDQFLFPRRAEPAWPSTGRLLLAAKSDGSVTVIMASSIAVAMVIPSPRCSAARVAAVPSAFRARRAASSRRRASHGTSPMSSLRERAAKAAHSVMASAQRPVATHSNPARSRSVEQAKRIADPDGQLH